MKTCDALIVGGGPAGSSCARQLSAQGMAVIVMDKALFPRNKVCAGWITPDVVDLLQLNTQDYAEQHVLQSFTAFRTGMIDGRELETKYPATVSFGIRRCEFDDYLLRRSGANLWLGQALESLERRGRRWILNGAISTPLIIGAGGHFCPVARFLGARPGSGEIAVTAQEIEFEMTPRQRDDCQVRPDMPELYFCPDLNGYGWCLRKGNHLNIGIGREGSRGLAAQVALFGDFLKKRGRIPCDLPDRFHGHAYLLYGHANRKLLDDGVLLVGDAAGLAYAKSGEGIRPAVESGLMAAAAIREAAEDYRRDAMKIYPERLIARYGSATTPVWVLPGIVRKLFAGVLMQNRWFTRHVVLDRWFLRNHQTEIPCA